MSKVRKRNKRPLADKVNKFIEEFTDLKYDGAKIVCKVCDKSLMCWSKRDCRRHMNTVEHKNKTIGERNTLFMFDLTKMFLACNLPLRLVEQQSFRHFWSKYSPSRKLPSRTTLRASCVSSVREDIENKIKSELANKYLWLCVGATTDIKRNSIVNVIVRALDPQKSTAALLLASKRLENYADDVITRLVLNTLTTFQLSINQILMLVTEDNSTMRCVGRSLKNEGGLFLHITCKIQALHLVAENIRQCYTEIDALISETKAVFGKSSKRIQDLYRHYPGIPEPPQLSLARWETWLQATFYYCKYFQQIKSVILQLNPKEAAAIKISQQKFQDSQVETDLQTIQNNYLELVEALEKLENPALSLVESLRVVDDLYSLLAAVSNARNNGLIAKVESILNKDSDFITLKQICNGSCTDSLSSFKDYFNYANITSLDVEQSFSAYKSIFSSRRTSFAETSVEAYLMLQFYFRSHLAISTDII